MEDIKLSIIIPVYNEVNTILEIIKLVQKEQHKKEIIIIDDNSTDETKELLEKVVHENIKVLFNKVNKGKGYCIRKGIEHVSGDIVIIQDADLEYYPDEYGILIAKITEGKADVVYGSRFLGAHRVFHFYHYLGNTVLNIIANIMLNTNLTDLMTCYKAFRTPVIKSLVLRADRFGIEPEMTAGVFKHQYRVYEVPISYNGRTYDEGKKIKWTDFFRCLYWLFRAVLRGVDVGKDTLLKMRVMKNNNRWTYNTIKPYLGAKMLELGSGIGTFSAYLIKKKKQVTLTDINLEYIKYLKGRFIGNPNVDVKQADAVKIDEKVGAVRFDTVVAINILEHIENDTIAIEKFRKVLVPQGKLILVVPAHRYLYGNFDKGLGHYRRYSKKELMEKLTKQGFTIEKIRFMNFLSALGWFSEFKILRKRHMSLLTIRLGDMLIPLIACVEKYIKFPFGLSLFCVAKRVD